MKHTDHSPEVSHPTSAQTSRHDTLRGLVMLGSVYLALIPLTLGGVLGCIGSLCLYMGKTMIFSTGKLVQWIKDRVQSMLTRRQTKRHYCIGVSHAITEEERNELLSQRISSVRYGSESLSQPVPYSAPRPPTSKLLDSENIPTQTIGLTLIERGGMELKQVHGVWAWSPIPEESTQTQTRRTWPTEKSADTLISPTNPNGVQDEHYHNCH